MRVLELDNKVMNMELGVDTDLELFKSLMSDVGSAFGLVTDVKYGGYDVSFKGKGVIESMLGYDIGLNTHRAHLLAKDKENCSIALASSGVSTIPHIRLNNSTKGEALSNGQSNDDLIDMILDRFSFPLVVKDNKGGGGKNVFLVNGVTQLSSSLADLMAKGLDPCVSPYYEFSTEYRVVVLDNEVMLSFGKRKQDGSFQHNLSSGAVVVGLPVELESDIHKLAVKACKTLKLRFATVDVVQTMSGLKVLEVNDSVTLKRVLKYDGYYDLAYNTYKSALNKVLGDSINHG